MKNPGKKPVPGMVAGLQKLVGDLQKVATTEEFSLAGKVCASTSLLGFLPDGVSYCGHTVQALAHQHQFDEVAWLLLHGQLPDDEQLSDWDALIAESAGGLQASIGEMFSLLPPGVRPVDLLPFAISLLAFFDPAPGDVCAAASVARVGRILGQLPRLLDLALNGGPSISAAGTDDRSMLSHTGEGLLSWSGRLLQILRGSECAVTVEEDAAMNVLMICQCLTEMRPACFTARATAVSTRSLFAALQSAATVYAGQTINDPWQWAGELLRSFLTPDQAASWYRSRDPEGMPFGFASSVPDARVRLMQDASGTLLGSIDRIRAAAAASRLEKILATRNQLPTIDWAAVRLMTLLEIPADRQALTIALARIVGWSAQALEQQKSGISLLPALRYASES